MTHNELTSRAIKWLYNNQVRRLGYSHPRYPYRCNVVLSEMNTYWVSETPDAIGWSRGYRHSVLLEVKTSLQDFKADQHKSFRKEPLKGMGNYRLYVCPTGLIKIAQLPDGWGLIYATAKRFTLICHAVPFPKQVQEKEFDLLLAALRRVRYKCEVEGKDFQEMLQYKK